MDSAKKRRHTLVKRRKRWFHGGMKAVRLLAALGLAAVVLAAAAFFLREEIAERWLRRELAGMFSRQLGAEVKLDGIRYRKGVLHVERCQVGGGAMPFAALEVHDASMPMSLKRLRDWPGPPVALEAREVDLVWRDAPPARSADMPRHGDGSRAPSPALDILIGKFSFRHEDPARWQIKDTAARVEFAGGAWVFSARGGRLTAAGWPELGIERASGEQRGDDWDIGSFALGDAGGGALGGSVRRRGGQWSGEFSWQDVALQSLLPASAAPHFTGRGSGDARLAGGMLTGQMKINDAVAKNLPTLVKLASIFTGENYSAVPWQSLRFKFQVDATGAVEVRELSARSPKGLAVEGSGRISGGGDIGADLQLGLQREGRPWLVAFMPALFRSESQGYLWTPVRVGGTLQAPTENLTPRIITSIAAVPASRAVESAVEIPAGAAEAAAGLLRSLLGP